MLRSQTLASIKPEISQALASLLDEIRASDDAKILRTAVSTEYRRPTQSSRVAYKPTSSRRPRQDKTCPLCQQAGRSEVRHFLSECKYLPDTDRRYIVKARQILGILDDESEADDNLDTGLPICDAEGEEPSSGAVAYRVQTRQSPYMDVFHGHHVIRATIDSGATGNMIRYSLVKRLGFQIVPSAQSVHQADGCSKLHVVGETRISFTRDNREFKFEGLVVENLDVDVLAGTPFMELNDIAVRPAKREVTLGDGTTYTYGSTTTTEVNTAARRAFVLRAPTPSQTIWPGEFLEVQLPDGAQADSEYAIEPRTDARSARRLKLSQVWPPPSIVSSVAGRIRIPNTSTVPHTLKRNEHFCQASPVFEPTEEATPSPPHNLLAPQPATSLHSSPVQIDPDNLLPQKTRVQFQSLLKEYDVVFDPNFKGYMGTVGPFMAKVNMGPVEPPQRKGRLPQYARGKLVELQEKFDKLEELGVFKRPEDIGISVEYLNPSFLVKKPNGGSRLVTASSHRVNTLASCPEPDTVGRMRSFVGAYKVLSRVIPRCSTYLAPPDDATAGRQSKEAIVWTDELRSSFQNAQRALSSARTITLPRPDDQLCIVTDGAVREPGLGATLYVTRKGNLHLAGFFSAKLRGAQTAWLPCEVEALSIAAATKHFSPYIVQSSKNTCVLTDSKPCVQAYDKLCRGEFSASPRVSTFLSVVSRYQASVRHVSGSAILPSDFASRNAPPCEEESCQVCSFILRTKESVVRMSSVQDVLDGNVRLPFTSRPAWLAIQSECPDLRRTHSHLVQGTRPSRKLTNVKDVKRYLQVASVASDGLLVVKRHEPLSPSRECIVVPRQALDGLLTALHIQLNHPSSHQLKTVVKRYLYALDIDKAIANISDGCHSCARFASDTYRTRRAIHFLTTRLSGSVLCS